MNSKRYEDNIMATDQGGALNYVISVVREAIQETSQGEPVHYAGGNGVKEGDIYCPLVYQLKLDFWRIIKAMHFKV